MENQTVAGWLQRIAVRAIQTEGAMQSSVSFSTPAGQANGYLVRPGSNKVGVVVLQEWWGLVPHIKDVASRFASAGFVALAPDLYHGKSTVDAEEASHLMKGLDWGLAAQEIAAAVSHLRTQEGCSRVAVVGFCMGGALTVIAASQPGVDAYAAFYGFPPAGAANLDGVSSPGLLFFGEKETFFSIPDAKAFAEKQAARGIATEAIVYEGAGHAFFNDARPEAFRRAPANDSWRRTLTLFNSLR
jgi:carboxymethylenebutenolidase